MGDQKREQEKKIKKRKGIKSKAFYPAIEGVERVKKID